MRRSISRASPDPVLGEEGQAGLEQGDILTLVGILAALVFIAQTLTQGRKFVPQLVGLAVLISALGGYFAYRQHEKNRKAQEQATRMAEFERRIFHFAESHNAVRDWQKSLDSKGKIYSAELAPVLVRQDGRPIFSFASVDDVSTIDGQFIINFKDESYLYPPLKLRLRCTPDQAHLAMSNPSIEVYAVIAQVETIDLVNQAPRDDDTDGSFFQAKGRCIDVMHLRFEEWFSFTLPATFPSGGH
jgi:hypothetical protein